MFYSTFRSVHFSTPYIAMFKIQYFTSFFFKFKSILPAKSFPVVERYFCHGNPIFSFTCTWEDLQIYTCRVPEQNAEIQFTKMTNKMQLYTIIYYSLIALHISSDIFAHHQEHLNCMYSFWYYFHVSLPAGIEV
jgi:hypothetical protein